MLRQHLCRRRRHQGETHICCSVTTVEANNGEPGTGLPAGHHMTQIASTTHRRARTRTRTRRQTYPWHTQPGRGNRPSVRLRSCAGLGLALTKPRRSWHERCRAAGCHGSWFDRPLTARETSARTTEAPLRTSTPEISSTSPAAKRGSSPGHEAIRRRSRLRASAFCDQQASIYGSGCPHTQTSVCLAECSWD